MLHLPFSPMRGCLCPLPQIGSKFPLDQNYPGHPHDKREVTATAFVLLPSRGTLISRDDTDTGYFGSKALATAAFYPFFVSSHIFDYNLGPCVAMVTNSPRTQTSGSWTFSHWDSESEGFFTSPVYGSGVGSTSFTRAATRAEHYRDYNMCVHACEYSYPLPQLLTGAS